MASSPYVFAAYYLKSPCHRDGGWMGKRAALAGMGWNLLPVYVGQLVAGSSKCVKNVVTAAQGEIDELERSLLEIVHSPSKATATNLDQLRRRIDAASLLFKVRVLGDELRQRERQDAPRPRALSTQTS